MRQVLSRGCEERGARVAELEVADRIASAGPQLTGAERRVAQAVLEHPHLVAFGTVADLAAEAGAGAATVVRLAAKLGFDGFSALQSSVQDDLARQLRPAAERIRELADRPQVERHRALATANVAETIDNVNREGFEAVVRRISDLRRPVLVLAGEAEYGVAMQFVHDLGALRDGVSAVSGNDVAVRRQLALSPPSSTLVVIDLRRYERWLLDAVTLAGELGHAIVACTDGPLSPLAMTAEYSFTLAARSASPFDSQVGTLTLLELIVAAVAERLRDTATSRLERVETAWAAAHSLTDG
jgi:DNA-binding MurR/RpiR family transcriptional regulator